MDCWISRALDFVGFRVRRSSPLDRGWSHIFERKVLGCGYLSSLEFLGGENLQEGSTILEKLAYALKSDADYRVSFSIFALPLGLEGHLLFDGSVTLTLDRRLPRRRTAGHS